MTVYLDAISSPPNESPYEGFVSVDGTEMYRIPSYDKLDPFLIAVTSDSNLWMYVSSSGALTAGRVDYEQSLFPYETEDRLHKNYGITGPVTLLRVKRTGKPSKLWEPFSTRINDSLIERNLYKTPLGNQLMFEEVNHDLELIFRYTWSTSARFGFVRSAELISFHSEQSQVELIDGLANIMPAGVPMKTQQGFSCLVDAYKYSEIDPQTRLAIYSLTSLINDRPEPLESLTANIVWSRGLQGSIILNDDACDQFRNSCNITSTSCVSGQRGAFFIRTSMRLMPRQRVEWEIIADVMQDHISVSKLLKSLENDTQILAELVEDIHQSDENLKRIVGEVDGLQASGDHMSCVHHSTNALFNVMRGGVPLNPNTIKIEAFSEFVKERNSVLWQSHRRFIESMPIQFSAQELVSLVTNSSNSDLIRLGYEYLPLTFSRRHGDPSRPWNRFAIQLYDAKGNRKSGYEGNWRDIFQNWEALGLSYPSFIENFICKFVNASTVDGFNPYRVTSAGIDWEIPDENDPWSHIGYWGDHQIIYLLRLMEWSQSFHPGKLQKLLFHSIFSYANVPYRIDSYRSITQNPRETIQFDTKEAGLIEQRVNSIGADGKLLLDDRGNVYHVNLLEKLLVPFLTKLCNYVPDGGIWMNTQRPEWNDANNALAGYGLSVVTLAHLRRYLVFLEEMLSSMSEQTADISAEISDWACRVLLALTKQNSYIDQPQATPEQRRGLMDELGEAFEDYRHRIYGKGFSGKRGYRIDELIQLLRIAKRHIDHTLKSNIRSDELYHSYNLLDISGGDHVACIGHLDVMLEGQVAILGSGWLNAEQAQQTIHSLYASRLYREDQHSFMLYPIKRLGGFMDKNVIPENQINANPLLKFLLKMDDCSVIARDASGIFRFNGKFQCRQDVKNALMKLTSDRQLDYLVSQHLDDVLKIFHDVFKHSRFTGRSSHMYGYEGIGCIYWHMVSKLLLAAHDSFWTAAKLGASENELNALVESYAKVRNGLEMGKTASVYGAFPTDPYSHTPLHRGAAQPGMTGRVKEEIITRFSELGLRIEDGRIGFDFRMFRKDELLEDPEIFSFVNLSGDFESIELLKNMAGFTFVQVPIIVSANALPGETIIIVYRANGTKSKIESNRLDPVTSAEIFDRTGKITRLDVSFDISQINLIQS